VLFYRLLLTDYRYINPRNSGVTLGNSNDVQIPTNSFLNQSTVSLYKLILF